MPSKKQIQKIFDLLDILNSELEHIKSEIEERGYDIAWERLNRWHEKTIRAISEFISKSEGEKLADKGPVYIMNDPLGSITETIQLWGSYLKVLREQIHEHSYIFEDNQNDKYELKVDASESLGSKKVFIIHGHDDTNLERLEKLLKDRWALDTIILRYQPGKGRTIIEKFEQEAYEAKYAFAIFTPDDIVKVSEQEYAQARPNVIFEVGWFCGKLGRKNVCILWKKGTKIHSDLEGISRIEFDNNIEEKFLDIERELKSSGLI